jgi:phosphoenolpyruvate synthase/pyruvate phosphate dikinase
MMSLIISLKNIHELDLEYVGGKAYTLGILLARGLQVPSGLCITTKAYSNYVRSTGLMERISLELYRKDFSDMRWEEMWDASLRIRNMFLNTPMSSSLVDELKGPLEKVFGERPVAVRSSAPGEDSTRATFAGLHETYMNVCGVYSILEHIRLVWASLWADGALLYRQEMGLDVTKSSMAVLVQELIRGDKSGVVFGENPNDEGQAVIESVYGLNQGLVDGTVEPDRWILDREEGTILSHTPAKREQVVVPTSIGTHLEELAPEKRDIAPLSDDEVRRVYELAMKAEEIFGSPQDVEWTFRGGELFLLQSRPITAISGGNENDERSWYLTLRRSFGNLKHLRAKIEEKLIPEMIEIEQNLAKKDCTGMSDDDLGEEIVKRERIYDSWEKCYWRYFIPFAHGMRLFGQVYNDTVRPVDPYEFMDLLATKDMISLKRNSMLEEMAKLVRKDMLLMDALKKQEDTSGFTEFTKLIDEFIDVFGDLACGAAECSYDSSSIIKVVRELSLRAPGKASEKLRDTERLANEFLSLFAGEMKAFVTEVLDIARASYRLRDDDNIYLGRIKRQVRSALDEGRIRLEKRGMTLSGDIPDKEVARALKDPQYVPEMPVEKLETGNMKRITVKARQLIGQPASRGIVSGIARVLDKADDLLQFRAGEILVCDALDPSMTFIVPLALGIVERRGGMLIHGAIIAREYGLPCVTGVPDATELIQTGNQVTVDGYLGIVAIA